MSKNGQIWFYTKGTTTLFFCSLLAIFPFFFLIDGEDFTLGLSELGFIIRYPDSIQDPIRTRSKIK